MAWTGTHYSTFCVGLFLCKCIWILSGFHGDDSDVDTSIWDGGAGSTHRLCSLWKTGLPVRSDCVPPISSFHTRQQDCSVVLSLLWRPAIVSDFSSFEFLKKVSMLFHLSHNDWRKWPAYLDLHSHQTSSLISASNLKEILAVINFLIYFSWE